MQFLIRHTSEYTACVSGLKVRIHFTTGCIVSCLQRTFEDTFIFYLVWGHGAFVTFMIYLHRV